MTKTRKTLNHGSLLHPNTHAFSTLVHQMCIQFGKKNKFNILAGKKKSYKIRIHTMHRHFISNSNLFALRKGK